MVGAAGAGRVILVVGSVTVADGHLDEALALGREHSARSRGEPGCLSHNVHQDAEKPNRIVFVERWESMAALKAHFAVPASGAFVETLRGWSVSSPELTVYNAAETRP